MILIVNISLTQRVPYSFNNMEKKVYSDLGNQHMRLLLEMRRAGFR